MDLMTTLFYFKSVGATADYFKKFLAINAITQDQYDQLTEVITDANH